jgi:hypothetical protein
MSPLVREQEDDRIELGTEISWPHIYAAAGLGLFVMIAGAVLFVVAAMRGGRAETVAVVTPPTPRQERLARKSTMRESSPPRRLFAMPAPAPKVAAPEPPAKVQEPAKASPRSRPAFVVSKVPAAPPARKIEPPAPVEEPPLNSFKRLSPLSEEELLMRLARDAKTLDIETVKGTTKTLLAEAQKKPAAKPSTTAILDLVAHRPDLEGLPLRKAAECQALQDEALEMCVLSSTVGRDRRGTRPTPRTSNADHMSYSETIRSGIGMAHYIKDNLNRSEWKSDVGARFLVQMFGTEGYAARQQIIKKLSGIKGKVAGAALARSALFDVHPDLREEAVQALKDRPRAEYRPVLLEALRYPWPPVADHAAEAIVALEDRDILPDLARLLDKLDPQAPIRSTAERWTAPELVRVNHLGNCVLCHAPSCDKRDPVRGVVPVRGEPLPVVYYGASRGDFVRADVTYLKQDFSLMETVEKPDKWPDLQRFDYLVRQRELSAGEVACLPTTNPASYPQREAVLWAMRELAGSKLSPGTAWSQLPLRQWANSIR